MSKWSLIKIGKFITPRQTAPDPEKIASGEFSIVSKISFALGQIELRDHAKTNTNMITIMPGDLVVSGINAGKGAIAIYGKENKNSATATIHYSSYEVNSDLADIEYLWYFFRSEVFREILRLGLPNGIKTELRPNKFITLEIPLPPLPEQKRLVKKIKEVEEKNKKIKKLQDYDTGTIIRSFSDNYFSNNFEEKTFKDIFDVTKLAGFEYSKYFDYIEKPGIIALRAQNVKNEGLKLNEVKYISNKLSNFLVRSKLNKNDIVMTFIGYVGEAAIIDENNKYHCAPNIAKLTVKNQTEIDPYFALAQIRSPFVQDQIINITRQTAQPSLSMRIIRVLKFKVPPKEKQKEYMDKLNNFKKSIGLLKLEKEKRNSYLTALVPSITAKAFNGEL